MASIIMLGPGQWKTAETRASPLDIRRRIAAALATQGHEAVLLEDEPGDDAPLQDKFESVLRRVTDVVVY